MQELGYKDYDIPAWWAAWAPAGTPPAAVKKLEGWLNKIVASDETRKFLANVATDPYPGDAEKLGKMTREETAKWARLLDLAKIEKQ